MHSDLNIRGIIAILLIASSTFLASQPVVALNDSEKPLSVTISSREHSPLNAVTETVVREMYRRIGYAVKFEHLPGNRAITLASHGKVDGDVSRLAFITKKFPDLRIVPVPIFYSELVALSTNEDLKIGGWESLGAYQVVAPSSFKLIWNKLRNHKNTVRTPDTASALLTLINGHAEVAVLNKYEAERLIDVFNYQNISPHLPPLEKLPIYHILHKKNEHLITPLTAAIKQMSEDGSLKKIWIERGATPPE